MTAKFIILDRDGVINFDSVHYIKTPEEWHPIPGSLEAIAELNRADFKVFVTTNQSGIGRGYYDHEMLERIHQKLAAELALFGGEITEIFFCPHHPNEGCECRKPKLGMFYQIQKKYSIPSFQDIFYIGDSYVDMQAALALPCKPILVLTSNGKITLENHPELFYIPHFANLAKAVQYILSERDDGGTE